MSATIELDHPARQERLPRTSGLRVLDLGCGYHATYLKAIDAALFISVLQHDSDPVQSLSHCHRVLKPGGRLLVNIPTWYAKPVLELSAFRFGTSPACDMDEHKMYYSKRDLWPLLVRAGFKPSRIRLQYRKLCMILFAASIKQ